MSLWIKHQALEKNSIYMLIGIRYEERDLVATFGERYVDYRRRVGMLVPGVGRR